MIIKITITILIALLFIPSLGTIQTNAGIIDTLKEKIKSKSSELEKLQEEIKAYERTLVETAKEATSLQREIKTLNVTKQKIDTDIKKTEVGIKDVSSTIETLAQTISRTEREITEKISLAKKLIRDVHMNESNSLVETMLTYENLGELSELIEHTSAISNEIKQKASELQELKANLEGKKNQSESKKKELQGLKTELSGKKQSVQETEKQKDSLLKVTKNKEENYKKVLEEKKRLKDLFEKELFQIESELRIAIDPSKLPSTKGGVLSWPLEKVTITQQFGATANSKRLYTSGTHNGIDLRATDGTTVKASLSGYVEATGNTDLKNGCYSYGKWILIKHANGLSTLYAHLSSIVVSSGQNVVTGDTIGYSGRTGYVTGPHLHLTVFATEGTRVLTLDSTKAKNCVGVTIPVADPKAYLDPMLYLPR